MIAFKDFIEDYNTATMPHDKYYNLEAWEMKEYRRLQIEKANKSGEYTLLYFTLYYFTQFCIVILLIVLLLFTYCYVKSGHVLYSQTRLQYITFNQ